MITVHASRTVRPLNAERCTSLRPPNTARKTPRRAKHTNHLTCLPTANRSVADGKTELGGFNFTDRPLPVCCANWPEVTQHAPLNTERGLSLRLPHTAPAKHTAASDTPTARLLVAFCRRQNASRTVRPPKRSTWHLPPSAPPPRKAPRRAKHNGHL